MHLRPFAIASVLVVAAAGAGVRALHRPAPAVVDFAADSAPGRAGSGNPTPDVAGTTGPYASWGGTRPAPAPAPAARHGDSALVVYVAGEVVRPGLYRIPAGSRIDAALRAAGGATAAGDLVAVNLAQAVDDGQEIAVPARGSPEADAALADATRGDAPQRHRRKRRTHGKHARHRRRERSAVSEPQSGSGGSEAAQSRAIDDSTASAPVDVNSASEAELETLPGIGPALAARIVAFRDLNGAFASSDELLDVAGMTPGKLDALAELVTFHGR